MANIENNVVANAIITKIEKTSCPITPCFSAIEAMINSTAPRLFIASPIIKACFHGIFCNKAAPPDPITLPRTATNIIAIKNHGLVVIAVKSKLKAKLVKKIGQV